MRPVHSRSAVAVLVSAIAASGNSCVTPEPRGVLFVTLDTTRADRLGCYGYAGAKTPHLDALAAEGTRFARAQAAVPTTLASHVTMFTGLYPPAHGVRYNGMFKVARGTRTIAEVLRGAGWATGGIPASFPVTAKSGLDKGFDAYRDLFSEPGGDRLPMRAERRAEDVVRLATAWLDGVGERRFFLWVHLFDPHWPYEPPFPFSAEFAERPYDGEVAYADRELGKLFEALRAKGLWRETVIVVAGDHGEGLYEHNERQHGSLVYETTLHVPLIVKGAGRPRAVVVEEPVTLADVAPTILDLAGVPVPAGLHGISLRGALSGRPPERRELYFESLTGSLNYGWSPLEGLRRGKWKVIRSSAPELYDLEDDPQERTNVITREAQVGDDLQAHLDASLASWTNAAPTGDSTRAAPDAEALARLASLGYVGGTVSGEGRGGPAPASKIHLEGELLQLRDLSAEKEWAAALEAARRVLADDPGNRFALYHGALAASRRDDLATARSLATACTTRYPDFTSGWVLAAEIEIAAKDLGRAVALLREALARTPSDPKLGYMLAVALVAARQPAEATRLVDAALQAPGADPSYFVVRGLIRARAGDEQGAMAALRDAFARGYRDLETLRSEPLLAPLRSLPGFRDAVAAVAAE